jgi:hypothetical protein
LLFAVIVVVAAFVEDGPWIQTLLSEVFDSVGAFVLVSNDGVQDFCWIGIIGLCENGEPLLHVRPG